MFDELNIEWMNNYEETYRKYKKEWDFHYEKIRKFILNSIDQPIKNFGFIGVTKSIPELNQSILEKVEKLTLIDIHEETLEDARIYLESKYGYTEVETMILDNTLGYLDQAYKVFIKFQNGTINENKVLEKLRNLEYPTSVNLKEKFDFIAHMGILDFYFMPLFIKYCKYFELNYTEFLQVMIKLNDDAVKITLDVLNIILDSGSLIISTPIKRTPEGEKCNRSLFWLQSIEKHIEEKNYIILVKSEHIWEEFPEENGHSHTVLNIKCKKINKK
jgi:hypothetical protein